jgi:hypothetical protein
MPAVAAVTQVSPAVEISTLDALYEEAARVSLTPGWAPRKKPILCGLSRSRIQ